MILITGAQGFLGRYLVEDMSHIHQPFFLTTSQREIKHDKNGFPLHYLNLTEPESFSNLPDEIDTVVHLAALIPRKNQGISFEKYIKVNVLGTKRLMEAVKLRNCKRFIYASTQMVIEKPFYLPVDENHPLVPLSDYGLSKAVGERLCLSLARELNIQTVSLRFSRIFGIGENPGFLMSIFIERAIKGLPLKVYGTGRVRRDLIYVKDAARALIKAIDSDTCGVLNIGSGEGISIKEMAETISQIFGIGKSVVEFDTSFEEEGEDLWLDVRRAGRDLGFAATYTFRKGLEDYQSILLDEPKGH